MKILCLNTWGGKLEEKLFRFIEERAPETDIFCFQEVFSGVYPRTDEPFPGIISNFDNLLEEHLPTHTCYRSTSNANGEMLFMAIRSSLSVSDHSTISVYQKSESPLASPPSSSNVLLQSINIENSLTVAQIHGYWEKDNGEDKPPRAEQTNNLLKFIDSATTPVVLCGDFNTNPKTQSIERISKRLSNHIRQIGTPSTRPDFCPWNGTTADYMFTSPEIKTTSFSVLKDVVSDHLPLLLTIESIIDRV